MTVLETDRLILRRLSTDDAPFILELLNEPAYIRTIGDRGVRTLDAARKYILEKYVASYERFGFGLYSTTLKQDGIPIGICGLIKREALQDVDVGFALLQRFWGSGYASEAAGAVMDYGKTAFGLTRIVAIALPENHGSIRVLQKLGFRFERIVKLTDEELGLFAWGAQ